MSITAGSISLSSVGNTTDSLVATAATGGTTPYSYQWYRSTTTGFSPGAGSSLSGATALSLSQTGLVSGTQYYYKVVVIDSAGTPASASYSQLGVLTQGQSNLSLANVINISVSQAQSGLGEFNVNNLALFTSDTAAGTFGTDGYKIYLSPTEVATDFGTSSQTYLMALAVFSQNPNILAGGGYLVIILLGSGETLDAAITRTSALIQYFGIMTMSILSQADMLAAAAVIQAQNSMGFFVSNVSTSVDPGGLLDLLRSNSYTQSRGLYYGGTSAQALGMLASYAGRALSVNFDGSNTTSTMHLKDLVGVTADPSMTQTLLTKCQTAGVDVYVNIQGVSKVFCSGANTFFDSVYNLCWLVGAMEVAGFNYLAQSSTKIPQTEAGMTGLKSAYRQVLQQSVVNQYCAPGSWTSADTFGNLSDFIANVAQVGYYIYSAPIALQSAANRANRVAPLIQIALKEAGSIHSSDVIIFVNP